MFNNSFYNILFWNWDNLVIKSLIRYDVVFNIFNERVSCQMTQILQSKTTVDDVTSGMSASDWSMGRGVQTIIFKVVLLHSTATVWCSHGSAGWKTVTYIKRYIILTRNYCQYGKKIKFKFITIFTSIFFQGTGWIFLVIVPIKVRYQIVKCERQLSWVAWNREKNSWYPVAVKLLSVWPLLQTKILMILLPTLEIKSLTSIVITKGKKWIQRRGF